MGFLGLGCPANRAGLARVGCWAFRRAAVESELRGGLSPGGESPPIHPELPGKNPSLAELPGTRRDLWKSLNWLRGLSRMALT